MVKLLISQYKVTLKFVSYGSNLKPSNKLNKEVKDFKKYKDA